jgi:hypothetical protein
MIVGMALVAMCRAMAVTMIVIAMAVMVMVVMPATAALGMGMMMLVPMGMPVTMVVMVMLMTVIVMMMAMIMVVMVVAAAAIVAMGVVMHLRLRLEGALDRRHRAALPAHQFGQRRIVRNIEGVGRHLGRNVMAAEMPGEARQPQRILGPDLQKAFRCRLDLDEAAILQLQGIAVVQRGRLVERDLDREPARGRGGDAAAIAVAMGETERVGDPLGADGGLAKDGSGAKHRRRPHGLRPKQRLRARIAA